MLSLIISVIISLTPHSQMIINIDCASKIHRIRSHSSAQKKLTMLAYMYVIYACILEWALVVQ